MSADDAGAVWHHTVVTLQWQVLGGGTLTHTGNKVIEVLAGQTREDVFNFMWDRAKESVSGLVPPVVGEPNVLFFSCEPNRLGGQE